MNHQHTITGFENRSLGLLGLGQLCEVLQESGGFPKESAMSTVTPVQWLIMVSYYQCLYSFAE